MRRIPVVTLTIVGAAVVVCFLPRIHPALVYDRPAILGGELWRLITGQWVHFSAGHFLYDTLALGIAGWMIESRGYPNFGWLCALSPLVIGITLLALEPQLKICGGLSGVATAAVVFLTLHGLAENGAWRWICLAVLTATVGKIVYETMTGRFIFVNFPDPSLALVPASHIAGGLTALAVYLWGKIRHRSHISP
ncbi:MAG: rhombosortase [Verrucomicrobiota bacterium]|jgi:rhomboid family GlyGly-CTERM serine protease